MIIYKSFNRRKFWKTKCFPTINTTNQKEQPFGVNTWWHHTVKWLLTIFPVITWLKVFVRSNSKTFLMILWSTTLIWYYPETISPSILLWSYSHIPSNLMVNIDTDLDRQNFQTTKIIDPCLFQINLSLPQIKKMVSNWSCFFTFDVLTKRLTHIFCRKLIGSQSKPGYKIIVG